MMKQKLRLILLIMSIGIIGLTCKKPEPEIIATISINPDNTYEINGSSGNFAISVTSTTSWNVNSDKGWLRVDPLTGNSETKSVNVQYDANTDITDRTAIIKFKPVGTSEKAITVTQKGKILQIPSATTQSATNVLQTTATLNGTVNANGTSTNVTFEYGLTTNYGQTETALPSTITGNSNTNISANISGLSAGTYHYRVVATSAAGTAQGNDMTFVITAQQKPIATTQDATNKTQNSSILNGLINANGQSTTVTFEYGTTTSYGQSITATQSPVTGSTNSNVSATISGLTAGTTYHFRVVATNTAGTVQGNDLIFTTSIAQSLSVSPLSLDFVSNGDTKSVSVTSNTSWNASSSQSWCTVNTINGNNSATVNITCNANAVSVQRQAIVTFSASGLPDVTVTVTQAGAVTSTLSLSGISFNASTTAGSTTINVISNISWSANSDSPSWLSTSITSGNGNSQIAIMWTANMNTTQRTGNITFSGSGVTNQIFNVTQYGSTPSLPTVVTGSLGTIYNTTTTISGELTSFGIGSSSVSDFGFCMSSVNANPLTSDTKSSHGASASLVTFNSALNGLQPNTTYYVRAYATNSVGTAYGLVVQFKTLTK